MTPTLRRYLPFLMIVMLQTAMVFIAPSRDAESVATTSFDAGTSSPVIGADGSGSASSTSGRSGGGGTGQLDVRSKATDGRSPGTGQERPGEAGAAAPAAGGVAGCPSAEAIGIGGLGQEGLGCGLDPADPRLWPWSRPWMLTGDRSLCAPGGNLQQDVTLFSSPPCTPRFTGDNGGATAHGVTAETVKVVRYLPRYDAASQAILASQGLYDSPADEGRAQRGFTAFFEKHFDFYGRAIEWVLVQTNCSSGDATCYRNDAKAIVTEHAPFIVQAEAVQIGGAPEFFDELARRGVITVGGWGLARSFDVERRPFRWDNNMDGTRAVEHIAEYWCKKMAGQKADLAGDPLLATATRKLAITVADLPGRVEQGELLQRLVSGEQCGDASTRPLLIRHGASTGEQSEQAGPTAVKLQDAGVTTVVAIDPGFLIFLTVAMDRQQYFPEHLIAGLAGMDYDLVGRLNSTTQWRNAFGLSHRPKELPSGQTDDWRAVRDALGGEGWSCASCPGTFAYELQIASQLMWAGPNLTPLTFERGSLEAPQLNGYTIEEQWPGWKCCEPAAVAWRFGQGDYSANEDLKEIWWNPNQRSQIDGQPGTYLCEAECGRFLPGEWTAGPPVPSKPR